MRGWIVSGLVMLSLVASPIGKASAAQNPNTAKWLMQTIDFMYNVSISILEAAPGVTYEECTLKAFIEMESGLSLDKVDYVGYRFFKAGKVYDKTVGEMAEIRDAEGIAAFVKVLERIRAVPLRLPSYTGTAQFIRVETLTKETETYWKRNQACTIEPVTGGLRVRIGGKPFYFPCADDAFLVLADMTR